MFLLFHYYIILIINLLSFFWENISVFWYFHQFLICSQSSLGVTLRWITCNFIVIWLGYRVSNFITNHQLLFLVELPYFLGSFKCICCRLFSIIKKSLALFIFSVFTCTFVNIFTNIRSLGSNEKRVIFFRCMSVDN